MMEDPNKSDLENVCRELLSAFQGIFSWKWDSWVESVLAEFGVDNKDSIRAILERYLSSTILLVMRSSSAPHSSVRHAK